jgi:hypothetical protein
MGAAGMLNEERSTEMEEPTVLARHIMAASKTAAGGIAHWVLVELNGVYMGKFLTPCRISAENAAGDINRTLQKHLLDLEPRCYADGRWVHWTAKDGPMHLPFFPVLNDYEAKHAAILLSAAIGAAQKQANAAWKAFEEEAEA